MDQLLLTPADVAQALGISRSKVYELMATGAIPSVKIGSARRIPADCLAAFVGRLRHAPRTVA